MSPGFYCRQSSCDWVQRELGLPWESIASLFPTATTSNPQDVCKSLHLFNSNFSSQVGDGSIAPGLFLRPTLPGLTPFCFKWSLYSLRLCLILPSSWWYSFRFQGNQFSFYLFACVHVHACVCVCRCVWACVHVHAENTGQLLASSSITLHFSLNLGLIDSATMAGQQARPEFRSLCSM